MGDSYGTSYMGRIGWRSPSSRFYHRVRAALVAVQPLGAFELDRFQLCRVVSLMMVALLLTFGAVYKLTDVSGINSFWPEVALAIAQLFLLAASYWSATVRRHFRRIMQTFCYLTAAWFILLAGANGFDPNYAVGLLFIIPGLSVGYGVASRNILSLALFFVFSVVGALAVCYFTAGTGIASLLFVASLICISLLTMFIAAGWLDAQKRYLASEERYRAVVEQASDGIYLVDAQTGTFLDANRAFCQMVGMTMPQLRSTKLDELLLSVSSDGASLPFSLVDGKVTERLLKRSDGSVVSVEMKADRIRHEDGDILSVVVYDIQSRKEYEDRLLRAKESAEEIANFKSSLLANMSHEIRTPLCSILGWAAVLTDEVPDRQRDLVRLIEKSGRRLHTTLDSVIELAHLQANAKTLRPSVVDLNEEVGDAVGDLGKQAASKGLDLVFEIADDEVWAELDASCLRRILDHLIDNAIKFTDHGVVKVSVGRVQNEVAIAVEDTGPGIGEDFLPSLFDEFKQESVGLARDHEGNGLGLAIARRLAELIDGRIDVVTEEGVGSKFTVYVPALAQARSRRSA